MTSKRIQTLLIKINQTLASVDVIERSNGCFLCLFNKEEHKDYINGFGALGFSVVITILGTREDFFSPIPVRDSHTLTKEWMENIWGQIKEKRGSEN